jgi:uncharacterized protein YyaL (SSP411 family)
MFSLVPQIRKYGKIDVKNETIGIELKRQIAGQLQPKPQAKLIAALDDAYEQLFLRFDSEFGGFGRAPNFRPPQLTVPATIL